MDFNIMMCMVASFVSRKSIFHTEVTVKNNADFGICIDSLPIGFIVMM